MSVRIGRAFQMFNVTYMFTLNVLGEFASSFFVTTQI